MNIAQQHNRDFNEAAARIAENPKTFHAEWQQLYDRWHAGECEWYSVDDLMCRVLNDEPQMDYSQPVWTALYVVKWRDDKPGEITRYCATIEEAQAIAGGTIYHNNREKTLWVLI